MQPSSKHAPRSLVITVAAVLYLSWVLLTWLLEGRLETFLRPEATEDRAAYALVVNILVGACGGLFFFSWIARRGLIDPSRFGFPSPRRTVTSLVVALLVNVLVVGPRLPTHDPAVLLNAGLQVLVVSTAEVVVCWLVLGGALKSSFRSPRARIVSVALVVVVASAAFGLSHFAHSPPFNTWSRVLMLSGVGVATSIFFLVSRDILGTILFHNGFAMLGVVQALERGGRLGAYHRPQEPLLVMAITVLTVLATAGTFFSSLQPPRARAR